MLYSFLQTVTPYKSLSIYEQYFAIFELIHVYDDIETYRKVYLNLAVHLHYALLQFLFYCLPPASRQLRILLIDFFWAMGLNSSVNLPIAFQGLMVLYFYRLFYLDKRVLYLNTQMRTILFPKKLKDKTKWLPLTGRIQAIAWKGINALQVFTLVMDLVLLRGNLQFVRLYVGEVTQLWNLEQSLTISFFTIQFFAFLFHLAHLYLFTEALLQFAYVLILIGAHLTTTIAILYLSVKRYLAFLSAFLMKSRKFTWKAAVSSQTDLVSILEILFSVDRLYGRLLFAFLLVHLPCSAFLLVQLLFNRSLKAGGLLLVVGFIGYESSVTLVFHFLLARLSKRLQRAGPLLLRLNAKNQHLVGDSRAHMRFDLLAARLHTRRPYGVTYAGLALVTMATFTKCMLLYGRFIIFSYKLVQQHIHVEGGAP